MAYLDLNGWTTPLHVLMEQQVIGVGDAGHNRGIGLAEYAAIAHEAYGTEFQITRREPARERPFIEERLEVLGGILVRGALVEYLGVGVEGVFAPALQLVDVAQVGVDIEPLGHQRARLQQSPFCLLEPALIGQCAGLLGQLPDLARCLRIIRPCRHADEHRSRRHTQVRAPRGAVTPPADRGSRGRVNDSIPLVHRPGDTGMSRQARPGGRC